MEDCALSSTDTKSKRSTRNNKEVEVRRSIEDHMERRRVRSELGDIMDL